jgi:peptidoglycan/LPS O-acetylase OafA/YrhL
VNTRGVLGTWGVGMFFVLSGLCIHLPVARALAAGGEPTIQLGRYFKRRLFRIYPPHAGSSSSAGWWPRR